LGLGFLAGMRLYAVVLLTGIAVKLGWWHPPANLQSLELLAHPAVLVVAGVGVIAEFLADKVAWIDSAWDAIHTVVRPLGAAVLGGLVAGQVDPGLKAAIALLAGGAALSSHAAKATTRATVNLSPEPLSNIAMSLAGDSAVAGGWWLVTHYPEISLLVVVVLILLTWIVTWTLYRRAQDALQRLRAQVRRWFSDPMHRHRAAP
jgi:hypothetical protein